MSANESVRGPASFLPEQAFTRTCARDLSAILTMAQRDDLIRRRAEDRSPISAVCVVITEGKRSLQFGEPLGGSDDSMAHLLQRLTANGLRQLSTDRCIEIADEIEDNHPDLVIDTRVLEAV